MKSTHAARTVALHCTVLLLAGCATAKPVATPAPPSITVDLSGAQCETAATDDQAVIQWLAANAQPLSSVAPGTDTADLQPLKQILSGVRVVGLGEATHGTHEFFTMKHRLLEFLVKEMGYRTFAMEASYSGGLAVNRYVLTGEGNPEEVLKGVGFWTWNTQEILEMLKWMRTYNESVPTDQRVQFVGFDVQVVEPGLPLINKYLAANYTEERSRLSRVVYDFSMFSPIQLRAESAAVKQRRLADLQELVDTIDRDPESPKSATVDRTTAHKLAVNLYRYYDAYFMTEASQLAEKRDAYMAETLDELFKELGQQSKVVLWAHNAHVQNNQPWLGSQLHKLLGDEYYAMGLDFQKGAFRAVETVQGSTQGGPVPLAVGDAPKGSSEWYLRCAKLGNSLIDLRARVQPEMVRRWLSAARPMHLIGSTFAPNSPDSGFETQSLSAFDGLIYIPESTAARPNP